MALSGSHSATSLWLAGSQRGSVRHRWSDDSRRRLVETGRILYHDVPDELSGLTVAEVLLTQKGGGIGVSSCKHCQQGVRTTGDFTTERVLTS